MKSTIIKRSIMLGGHKTSISLEDEFWNGLKTIADAQQSTLTDLVAQINEKRIGNLSSAIRVFVLGQLRAVPA